MQPPDGYQPPNPYAPTQLQPAYGQPPGPPVAPNDGGAYAPALAMTPITLGALAVAGGFAAFRRFLLGPLLHAIVGRSLLLYKVIDVFESLVLIAAIIVYWVWLHRVTAGVRRAQGTSALTPGMAVGGWFIPFANIYFPYAGLADVWARVVRSSKAIVVVWWLAYLAMTALRITFSSMPTSALVGSTWATLMPLVGWGLFCAHLATYGLWIYIVATIAQSAKAPRVG